MENSEKPQPTPAPPVSNAQLGQMVFNAQINVPVTYANGASVGLSAADLQVTLAVNGRPTSLITMSLSTAKSLLTGIEKAIRDYERKTNTVILDLNQTSELIKKP